MRFDKSMAMMCKDCKSRAAHHRITEAGVIYCLALNAKGRSRKESIIKHWGHYDSASIHHIGVRYLKKSPIPQEVGRTIREGLSRYVTEPEEESNTGTETLSHEGV